MKKKNVKGISSTFKKRITRKHIAVVAILAVLFTILGVTMLASATTTYDMEVTPRMLRENAMVITIPATNYDGFLASGDYAEVTCPNGDAGIEVYFAHEKDPCFVRGN